MVCFFFTVCHGARIFLRDNEAKSSVPRVIPRYSGSFFFSSCRQLTETYGISRVAVLTGEGRLFCAGADLKEYVCAAHCFFLSFIPFTLSVLFTPHRPN